MSFGVLVAVSGIVAGAVAAVTGFGIGSLLTPIVAVRFGTAVAIALVAIPHAIGSLQRFWILRRRVDRRVLVNFGLASALGGLLGALGHARLSNQGLSIVFGSLLVLAGISELTGWMQRVRWGRRAAWIAGAVSGALGGLVGNQGSIRTASLLGFDVPKESFVATATAVALFVDGARLPVYLATQARAIVNAWPLVLAATAGVVIGTLVGSRVLTRLPERAFRRVVAVVLLVLGVSLLVAAWRSDRNIVAMPRSRGARAAARGPARGGPTVPSCLTSSRA